MCEHCQAVMINGVYCHEHGCPLKPRKCSICGEHFKPEPGQHICNDCLEEELAILEDMHYGDLDDGNDLF